MRLDRGEAQRVPVVAVLRVGGQLRWLCGAVRAIVCAEKPASVIGDGRSSVGYRPLVVASSFSVCVGEVGDGGIVVGDFVVDRRGTVV